MDVGPEAAAAEKLLDPAVLEEIISLDPDGSAGFLARVLETFIRSTEEIIRDTNWAGPATDPESIGKAAHSLKSSAGSIGARRLSALCASLEAAIRKRETIDFEHRFAQIQAVYLETREALIVALSAGEP